MLRNVRHFYIQVTKKCFKSRNFVRNLHRIKKAIKIPENVNIFLVIIVAKYYWNVIDKRLLR